MATTTTSKRFNLKLNDWTRGLLVAALTGPLTIIIDSLNAESFTFNWKKIATVALASGLAYVVKNFFTPAEIVIKNATAETVKAVKEGDAEVKVVDK